MIVLFVTYSDGCTYSYDQFLGIFSTKEKAEKAQDKHLTKKDFVGIVRT